MELVMALPPVADLKSLTPYGVLTGGAPLTATKHGVRAFPTTEAPHLGSGTLA